MIATMIEAYNELRHGKERLRMEIMGLKEDNASYKAMHASSQARAEYEKDRALSYQKLWEATGTQLDRVKVQLKEQQAYTTLCVKKLNTIRNLGEYSRRASQLPTEEEMSGDQ